MVQSQRKRQSCKLFTYWPDSCVCSKGSSSNSNDGTWPLFTMCYKLTCYLLVQAQVSEEYRENE